MASGSGNANAPQHLRLNLGGEAEVSDVINQQPEWNDLNTQASRALASGSSNCFGMGIHFSFAATLHCRFLMTRLTKSLRTAFLSIKTRSGDRAYSRVK